MSTSDTPKHPEPAGSEPDAQTPEQKDGLPAYMINQKQQESPSAAPEGAASTEPIPAPGASDIIEQAASKPESSPSAEPAQAAPSSTSLGAAYATAQKEDGTAIAVTPEGVALEPEAPAKPYSSEAGWPGLSEPARAPASPQTQEKPLSPEESRPAGPRAAKPAPKEKAGKKTPPKPAAPATRYPSFSQTHPVLRVEQGMPPSVGSRLYSALALFPLLPLTLMLLLQTVFTLNARELWFSEEVRNADIFHSLLVYGKGVILQLNGAPYLEEPPLYFWFLRGIHELVRTDGPMLHFTAAALSALLYLWAALGLGRLAARVDGRTNLAAGIILLSAGFLVGLFHHGSKDLIFSALVICSHIALYRGMVSPKSSLGCMIAAFVLAGAATLVKGPLAFALLLCSAVLFALWRGTPSQLRSVVISLFALLCGLLPKYFGLELLQHLGFLPGAATLPMEWGFALLALPALLLALIAALAPRLRICAGLSFILMTGVFILTGGTPYFQWPIQYVLPVAGLALFLLWQATPDRLFRLDFFIGLAVGVAAAGLWPVLVFVTTGDLSLVLTKLLQEQLLERAVNAIQPTTAWFFFIPLMLLPWTLLVLFLPWKKLFGKSMREGLAASRRPEREGVGFLWCMVIASVLVLSGMGCDIRAYLVAVLPPLALLLARALLALGGVRATAFRLSLAAFFLAAGVLFVIMSLMFFDVLPTLFGLPEWKMATQGGYFVVGAILLLAGAMLWLALGSSRPEGSLLVVALIATGIGYPLAGLVAPSLDAVLSPKNQALLIRAYMDQGYTAASFKVAKGTYSFYAGKPVKDLSSRDEATALAGQGKFALALPLSEFKSWEGKPDCLQEAQRQWLHTEQYVLLACPPVAGIAPAKVPYGPPLDIPKLIKEHTGLDISLPKSEVPKEEAPPAEKKAEPAETKAEPAAPAQPTAPAMEEGKLSSETPPPASSEGPEAAPVTPAPETPASLPPQEQPAPAQEKPEAAVPAERLNEATVPPARKDAPAAPEAAQPPAQAPEQPTEPSPAAEAADKAPEVPTPAKPEEAPAPAAPEAPQAPAEASPSQQNQDEEGTKPAEAAQ